MDVIERLNAVLKSLGLNQTDFAENIGISQSTLSKQLKGIHKIDKQAALAIQAVYGISSVWLLTGEGEMFAGNKSERVTSGGTFDAALMKSIITIVITMFDKEGLTMPPEKFAEFILFMYDRHKDKGGVTDKEIKDNVVLLKKFA